MINEILTSTDTTNITLYHYIKMIPDLLVYYVPGFIAISTYQYLRNTDIKFSEVHHSGACICISFLLKSVLTTLIHNDNSYLIGMASVSLGIILAFVLYIVNKSKLMSLFIAKCTHTAPQNTVLEGCDLDSPKNITITTENAIISGRIQLYNQETNDNWLAIDNVVYRDIDGSVKSEWWRKGKKYERYLIPFEEIKQIIVEYDDNNDKAMVSDYRIRAKKKRRNELSKRKRSHR